MKITLVALVLLAAVAPTSAASADIVDDLALLRAPASPGGATITADEAALFAALSPLYSHDQAILGLVVTRALTHEGAFESWDASGVVFAALRLRVRDLAISQFQVPGLEFFRLFDGRVVALLDRQSVHYDAVDLIYTTDEWATTRTASLAPTLFGYSAAVLADVPDEGRMRYAAHFFGADGRDFWLNNGRDTGVFGGTSFRNYSVDLEALGADPGIGRTPAFVSLVERFTHPASPGGETVTNDEFSLLVALLTYEGGEGVRDPAVLGPVKQKLAELEAAGVPAEGSVLRNMQRFVDSQTLPTASLPGLFFARGTDGLLTASLQERPAIGATIVFSTDGWNIPQRADCVRPGPDAPLECELGYIPPGTFIAYAVLLRFEGGDQRWIRAQGGNFFSALPAGAARPRVATPDLVEHVAAGLR